jgi:hypothetical protein
MTAVPPYLVPLMLGTAIVMIALVLFGMNAALSRAGWPNPDRAGAMRAGGVIIVGWFVLAALMAWSGFYYGAAARPPTIQYGILIPLVIGGVLLWRSQALWRVLDAIPQQWLIGIQTFRILGGVFLALYFAGRMPGLFALPAGTGDVLIGATAPLVALAYARNPRASRGVVAVWNVLGILDLTVALVTGFLTSPSPVQVAAFDHPNELISAFPLVLVPVYLVPLWLLMHAASLMKLRRAGM